MWIRYGQFPLLFLAVFSLSSLVYLRADTPLTKEEIRTWAETQDRSKLVDALVTVSLEAEKLNQLLIEERKDLTEYKSAVTQSVKEVRDEMKIARKASERSVASFEEALQIQAASMIQIKKELLGWKIAAGVAAATAIYMSAR